MSPPSLSSFVVCDLETAGLEASRDPDVVVWGGTLTTEHGTVWYDELDSLYQAYLDLDRLMVFHNGKFDARVLSLRGFNVENWHDTMVMSYQFSPGSLQDVDSVAKRLKVKHRKVKLPKDWDWSKPHMPTLIHYAKGDGQVQWQMLAALLKKFEKAPGAWEFYLKVDAPYMFLSLAMEDTGLYVAPDARDSLIQTLDESMRSSYTLIQQRHPLVPATVEWSDDEKTYLVSDSAVTEYRRGYYKRHDVTKYNHCNLAEFNPHSAGHVGWVLTRHYNWVPTEFTEKSQQPKTGADQLADTNNDFSAAVLEYLQASKIRGTFLKAFEEHSDSRGFVHGRFNTTRTRSGRLSSSEPK